MALENRCIFRGLFLQCHIQPQFTIKLTSDHIPEPEFQPPIESRVFSRGFLCFKLLNLKKGRNKVDLDFLKPPIAVPVAVVSVAALVRGGQVKPLTSTHINRDFDMY